jgi:hypothetical protein
LSISSEILSDELVSRWLSGKETLKEWVECFRIAHLKYTEESKPSIMHPVSMTEFKIKTQFSKRAEAYQTPLKRKPTSETAWSLTYTPYKKQLRSSAEMDRPEIVARAVLGLDDGLEHAGITLAELMNTYETSVKDLEMGLRALEYKADSIRNTVGAPTSLLSRELASPTAWGTVASIAMKLDEFSKVEVITPARLNADLGKTESKKLLSKMETVAASRVDSMQGQILGLQQSYYKC